MDREVLLRRSAKKIAQRAARIPPEVIEQGQHDWATLIREVETAGEQWHGSEERTSSCTRDSLE